MKKRRIVPAPLSYPQSGSRQVLREVGPRVDGAAIHDRHEVQVRAGRPTGHADVRDDLARRDHLSNAHDRRTRAVVEVAVERREVVAVRDDHDRRGVAVREVGLADGHDLSRGRGADRRVHRRGDVGAVVEAAPARTEARGDRTGEGPERKLAAVERAEPRLRGLRRGELRVERLGLLELLVERGGLVRGLTRGRRGLVLIGLRAGTGVGLRRDGGLRLRDERVVIGLLLRERPALVVDLALEADDLLLLGRCVLELLRRVHAQRADVVRELLVLAVDEDHRLDALRELGQRARRQEHLERRHERLAVRGPQVLGVEVLAIRELLLLHRGLRAQRLGEGLRLGQLERDERELLLTDLDLEPQRVGLRLGVGLLRGEVGDARVRGVHRGLEVRGRALVALEVGARVLDGALELILAPEGFLERVVGTGGGLLADDEGERRQRDERRAESALPPTPTSPNASGSSHARRMVPSGLLLGQGLEARNTAHLARCVRTDRRAPPAPPRSATPKTLPTSWATKFGPKLTGRTSRKSSITLVTGPAAAKSTASEMIAPSVPTSMPSRMKGQRTNQSDAPTSFMISISSRRACTAMRMVFTITKRATNSIIASTAMPPTESTRVMVSSWSTTWGLSTTS